MKHYSFPARSLVTAAFLFFFQAGLRPAQAAEPAAAQVVIVGGGLAGLVADYELQERGITAHLLEAADRFGGRVATVDYGQGIKAEYGLHEIWKKNPLLDYIKKFDLPLAEPGEPYSSVYLDGKLYPYVQDTAAEYFATLFTPAEQAEYDRWLKACEPLYDTAESKGLTPELSALQNSSFADWVGTFGLSAKVAEFIRLTIECEVARDWADISAVYGIQQYGIFLHGTEPCFHVKGGNTRIIDAFAAAIKGPKTLGAQVTRIVHSRGAGGKTEVVVYYKKDNVMRSVTAQKVIVTAPYHQLNNIQMEPGLTEQQSQAVETIVPGRYTVVHFILDTEVNKLLLVDGQNPFPVLTRGPLGVIYGFSELPAAGQKEQNFGLLIHGDYTRTYLEPQDKVRARLLGEMDKIWPGFSKYVHATYFYGYHPAAVPGWAPGRSPLDALSASLTQESDGLLLAGDYVYTSHSEGAVISARNTAKKAADGLKAD